MVCGVLVIQQPGAQWLESRRDQCFFYIFIRLFVIFPANFKIKCINNQIYFTVKEL